MALTFTQQQELETLLQEFKKENRLYGTVQITMNNDTILFKTTKGVEGDTYEDIAYHRGYVAAAQSYGEGYDDGYNEGYEEGYDAGYSAVCEGGE